MPCFGVSTENPRETVVEMINKPLSTTTDELMARLHKDWDADVSGEVRRHRVANGDERLETLSSSDPENTYHARSEQRIKPGVNQRLRALHLPPPRRIADDHVQHAVAQRDGRTAIDRRTDRRSPRKGNLFIGQRRLPEDLRKRVRDDAVDGNHAGTIHLQSPMFNVVIGWAPIIK